MASFSSTLRATLEMDLAPFAKNLTTADRRLLEFANSSQKSARESANVFTEVAAAEERLNAARVAQAEATNRSITASQGQITKAARESAAVFEQLFEKEKQAAEAAKEAAAAVDRAESARGGFGATGVSEGARRLAADLQRSDSILDKIRGKFSAGNILTSFLSGAGLASGFAVAEKAAALIASYWEKAAASATRIAEFSDRQFKATQRLIGLRETDEQRLTKARAREQSLAGQLNVAQRLGSDPERIAQLAAELQEAAADRVELEKKAEEKIEKNRKKAEEAERERREREVQWQIEANERERERYEAEQKRIEEVANAEREANRLEQEAHAKESSTLDQLNAAEATRAIIMDHLLSLEEGSLDFHKARQDLAHKDIEIARLKKQFLEEERKQEEAINKIRSTRVKLADANRDRVAFGVDDAAGGGRGTFAEQRSARRIQDLEARARRAYDRGAAVTERRDQRGNVIRETGEQESARLLGEADQVRRGFGNRLNSDERDPLASQKQNLLEALNEATTLIEIRDSLKNTPV